MIRRPYSVHDTLLSACLLLCAPPSWSVEQSLEGTTSDRQPIVQNACQARFQLMVDMKIRLGVPAKHEPRLETPIQGTSDVTVVLIHGLFESPYFLNGISKHFNKRGYNTLRILLPGHWESDKRHAQHVTYQQWLEELDSAAQIASCLGQRIIFAGHSLGGALALIGALKYPKQTAGLVLWAPAFQLKALPALGGIIGTVTRVSGNLLLRRKSDLDEIPYYAGNAVRQSQKLASYIGKIYGAPPHSPKGARDRRWPRPLSRLGVYRNVVAPTFLVIPRNDPAVQATEAEKMYEQLPNAKKMILYPKYSQTWHGNVVKSHLDTYKTSPKDFNKCFDFMAEEIEIFLFENGAGPSHSETGSFPRLESE